MQTGQALALLQWQMELGADEAISDTPVDRYELPAQMQTVPARPPEASPPPVAGPTVAPVDAPADAVAEAARMAAEAGDLAALEAAIGAYPYCDLKRGARNLVFADGRPGARVMIVGEAPGREEDRAGRPFVGRAGQLLDQMFAAIGMARDAADAEAAIYITNVLPWRPPENRTPTPEEIAMLMPFVRRHISLAAPDIVVAMGNAACLGLLGRKGITRLRGAWDSAEGLPVLPMFHPAYLLRNPAEKRKAWADLLSLQSRLREMS